MGDDLADGDVRLAGVAAAGLAPCNGCNREGQPLPLLAPVNLQDRLRDDFRCVVVVIDEIARVSAAVGHEEDTGEILNAFYAT